MYIYKITNTITRKSYIGKDTNDHTKLRRWKDHRRLYNKSTSGNSLLYKSMRKHGIANFTCEILYIAFDKGSLSEAEQTLIYNHNTMRPNGYNLTMGGDGGSVPRVVLTKREIEQRSEIIRQRYRDNDFRTKASNIGKRAAILRIQNETKEEKQQRLENLACGRGRCEWHIISPDGREYHTDNLTALAKSLEIPRSRLANAANGNERVKSGWVVQKYSHDQNRFGGPSATANWLLTYPDGAVCHIENLKRHCFENDLPYWEIYNSHRYTKRPTSKWKVTKLTS